MQCPCPPHPYPPLQNLLKTVEYITEGYWQLEGKNQFALSLRYHCFPSHVLRGIDIQEHPMHLKAELTQGAKIIYRFTQQEWGSSHLQGACVEVGYLAMV
jgi:hypothetical protein